MITRQVKKYLILLWKVFVNTNIFIIFVTQTNSINLIIKMMDDLINHIEEGIDKQIAIFEKTLSKETDKDKKKFLRGCIVGAKTAKLRIPIKGTFGIKCDDV